MVAEEESLLVEALRCKECGNRRFAARDDAGALRHYNEGLALISGGASSLDAAAAVPPKKIPGTGQAQMFAQLAGCASHVVSDRDKLAAVLHANSAQVFIRQRKWLESIEHCNAALRHDPSHPKAPWRGATAAIEVGMREVAVSFVETGLEEHPQCPELLSLQRRLGPLPEASESAGGADNSDDENLTAPRWVPPKNFELPPRRPPTPQGKEKAE
eukprot:TRINITY_DN14818_c0_g1_i1.p1 TRINITY_DN14818_c0_g1~~TRINITY_DN14818_c0_g1_i1.p1  ORF type:complete len:215 (-),score=49.53 TRINITY_DN14818_c0_g1_i1:122-766(-)